MLIKFTELMINEVKYNITGAYNIQNYSMDRRTSDFGRAYFAVTFKPI